MTEQVTRLVDDLVDGVVTADASGVVTLINSTACRMLDVLAEESVGAQLSDVLRLQDKHGVSWLEMNHPFRGRLKTRTGVPEQSWSLPSGGEVLTAARLLRREPMGPVIGIAISIRSGRGRARLDRDRSDLVATVAHELRSPLTGVKGFVQALLARWDKLSDEQKRLMLTTVAVDADRLSRLITELLDVARIDTGRLALYPRPSNVATLVGRVVDSTGAGTSRPVRAVLDEDLPSIWVDPDKFTQTITNLVENGLRHGDGAVTVSVHRLAPAGEDHPGRDAGHDTGRDTAGGTARDADGIRLTVDDEGTGIPPEIRRRVFTKFWNHGSRGGSGLGMYIVNGLVHAHGGTISIGDSPAGGARITTTWPAEPRHHD